MKIALAALLSVTVFGNICFAVEKSGPCADAAAVEAVKYASQVWKLSPQAQEVAFSNITPSSNPAPVQIYDVGIVRQDGRLVQFYVGLDYVSGKCQRFEVSFADY